MSAGKLNILIEQNATFNKVLTIYSTGTTPLNLTGKTLRGQIRYNMQDAEPAATFTFTPANQLTDPGVCSMLIPAGVTKNLKQSKGYYDVELVDGGTVTRLLEGQVFISLGATQS